MLEYPTQSYIDNGVKFGCVLYSDTLESDAIDKEFIRRNNDYYSFLDSYIGHVSFVFIYSDVISTISYYNDISDNLKEVIIDSYDKLEANSSLLTNINFVGGGNTQLFRGNESAKQFYNSTPEPILIIKNFNEFEYYAYNAYYQIPNCDTPSFVKLD